MESHDVVRLPRLPPPQISPRAGSSNREVPPVIIIPRRTSSLWNPTQLPGLVLWLDASDSSTIFLNGSTVAQYNDKSGNNNNAVQATAANQPIYLSSGLNGRPTLSYIGSDFMTATIAGLRSFTAFSYFSVFQTPAAAAPDTNTIHHFGFGNLGSASGPYPANRSLVLASTAVALSGEYITIAGEINNAGRIGSATYRRSANTPQIIAFQTSSAGTALWANGSAVSLNLASVITASTNLAPSAIGYTVDDNLYLNSFRVAGSMLTSPDARNSEIVVLSAIPSTADRERLEGYLAYRWGLTYELPSSHLHRWNTSLFGGTNLDGLDVDAKAYIAAVETADVQELEFDVKNAINSFIVGLKADGIWEAIKSSAILAGARTLTGALVPLKGTAPTQFGTAGGWNYNRKTGLAANGTDNYLSSNRNNNADPQNSNHNAVWVSTAQSGTTTGQYLGSGLSNLGRNNLAHSVSPVTSFTRSRTATSFDSFQIALGLFGHSRNNVNTFVTRVNGANTTTSAASATPENAIIDVFRRGTGNYCNGRLAFYSIGESLSLTLLDARVTTLMNTLASVLP
jgi:hypothetical protein